MKIKPVVQKDVTCDICACNNLADFAFENDNCSIENELHVCLPCAKKMYGLIMRTLLKKGVKND